MICGSSFFWLKGAEMAELERKFLKIFCENNPLSQALVQYGSFAQNGLVTFSTDPEVMQALDAYLDGWIKASEYSGTQGAPGLEDYNALHYIFSYHLAYLYQSGIPEWNSQTEYFINSFTRVGTALYFSLIDNNIGNFPPTSPPTGGIPFDISTASLVTSQSSLDGAGHIYLTDDGVSLYEMNVVPLSSIAEINAYTLNTPYDITTATFLNSLDLTSETLSPSGITFKPDLSILYIHASGSPNFYQYNLSTPGDITTVSSIASIFVGGIGSVQGMDIHNNGEQLYIADLSFSVIRSLPLSIPFDITTLGGPTALLGTSQPSDIIFKKDDYLKMYVMRNGNTNIAAFDEYNLTIAGDITTAVLQNTLDMIPFNPNMFSATILSDGIHMYTGTGETIYQFSMGPASWHLISFDDIPDGSITTAKLANSAVGALKLGDTASYENPQTRQLQLVGADFTFDSSTDLEYVTGTGNTSILQATSNFDANAQTGLHLPIGAIITQLEFFIDTQGANDIVISIHNGDTGAVLYTETFNNVNGAVVSSPQSISIVQKTLPFMNIEIIENSQSFKYALIDYTVTSPLP